MKKVLTIFSVFILGLGSSLTVTSCTSRVIHDIDDDRETNKDIETLNDIKKEVQRYLATFWNKKVLTDINLYQGHLESFDKVVNTLETENKIILTGDKIPPDSFLQPLLKGFLAEFNVINDKIKNDYSNYYDNTVPLELAKNNIQFTLYYINYNKLAKLVADSSQKGVKGISIQFDISYDVQFNGQQQPDQIKGALVVTNNVNAVSNMQDNLKDYFLTFIDDLFKEQAYEIIISGIKFNDIYASGKFWSIITDKLKKLNLSYANSIEGIKGREFMSFSHITYWITSVLPWAGEGYDPAKLTWENFLNFYKRKYKISIENEHYVKEKIIRIVPSRLMIENLPFKNPNSRLNLHTPIKVLVAKTEVDEELTTFAKCTMAFWKYYKLETYSDKLVFNMKQADFDSLLKLNFKQDKSIKANLSLIFGNIFDIFKKELKDLGKIFTWKIDIYNGNSSKPNFDLKVTKEQKSLKIKLLRIVTSDSAPFLDVLLKFHSMAYGILPLPRGKDANTKQGEFNFLHTIEFKVG